jgi:hypothetical protein
MIPSQASGSGCVASSPEPLPRPAAGAWLRVLRRYLLFMALANVVWELAQLPLYTLWWEGSVGEIAFAVVHCTGGDLLIATSSLVLALLLFADGEWPEEGYSQVMATAIVCGVGYTIFSEWLNTTIRGSWAYTGQMPVVPILGIGLSPLAQWIVIPLAASWWARWPGAVKRNRVATEP